MDDKTDLNFPEVSVQYNLVQNEFPKTIYYLTNIKILHNFLSVRN